MKTESDAPEMPSRAPRAEDSVCPEDLKSEHMITGRMAALFIDSKLTVIVMIAALLFGIWAILTTPREENPQITMPAAAVIAVMPGAEPAELEAKVVRPLEALTLIFHPASELRSPRLY